MTLGPARACTHMLTHPGRPPGLMFKVPRVAARAQKTGAEGDRGSSSGDRPSAVGQGLIYSLSVRARGIYLRFTRLSAGRGGRVQRCLG